MPKCKQCNTGFEITDDDRKFYDSVSPIFGGKKFTIPEPALCPDCRQQLRQSFRNERTFYRRDCSKCKKSMISVYEPGADFVVYCHDCWWGDGWSGLDFGVDFDFNRPFFEQWDRLNRRVPQLGLLINRCENSDYCNQTTGLKNCYLCVNSSFSEDSYYSKGLSYSRDCMDCFKVYQCELCYECVDCHNCYNSKYLQNCKNCRDSFFCLDCQGCSYCFGCAGLRNKQYYIYNKPVSPEEYEKNIKKILVTDSPEDIQKEFQKVNLLVPRPALTMLNAENCTGDCLYDSKNVQDSYDVVGGENLRFCYDLRAKDDNSYDITAIGDGISFSYETISSGINIHNCCFVNNCWDGVSGLLYCHLVVHGSADCLGSVGLRHSRYAIFNKIYSKEEYGHLAGKIIVHMQKTGEWGQFFPPKLSPFPYNASLAQEYYPLTRNEALKKGFCWSDYQFASPKVTKVITADQMPRLSRNIEEIPDDILNWALTCKKTGKLYKIIPQELEFYRKNHLSVPHYHQDERHRRRMSLRNPRKLYKSKCGKCQKIIKTTYLPDRPEIVYCEACYLKEVY